MPDIHRQLIATVGERGDCWQLPMEDLVPEDSPLWEANPFSGMEVLVVTMPPGLTKEDVRMSPVLELCLSLADVVEAEDCEESSFLRAFATGEEGEAGGF